jgi:hypothetical protein
VIYVNVFKNSQLIYSGLPESRDSETLEVAESYQTRQYEAEKEREMSVEHGEKHDDDKGQPVVEFLYLKTNDDAKFHVSWSAKLGEVWDLAYAELKEAKLATDQLECQSGATLMDQLQLTMADLRDKKVCQGRKFQIRSETGGA